jgi:phosphatidylserine/phosphatidylglycerophosphate/cardiolipin synthase-like enzyme
MQVTKLFSLLLLLSWSFISESSDRLGKTHFIISQPTKTIESPLSKSVASPSLQQDALLVPKCKILFAPDNNIRSYLLQLIAKEQEAIYLAIFMLTDPEISNALAQAKSKGIAVELITDVGCLKDRASKVGQLCKEGCSVYIYNPT